MDEAFYSTYQAKLEQKTVLAPNGQCLLWTGTRCRLAGGIESQYGIIYAKCKQLCGGGFEWCSMRVHRFAYIPGEMMTMVDHGRPWSPRYLMVDHGSSWSTVKYCGDDHGRP